jgi:hypothetical protein
MRAAAKKKSEDEDGFGWGDDDDDDDDDDDYVNDFPASPPAASPTRETKATKRRSSNLTSAQSWKWYV